MSRIFQNKWNKQKEALLWLNRSSEHRHSEQLEMHRFHTMTDHLLQLTVCLSVTLHFGRRPPSCGGTGCRELDNRRPCFKSLFWRRNSVREVA